VDPHSLVPILCVLKYSRESTIYGGIGRKYTVSWIYKMAFCSNHWKVPVYQAPTVPERHASSSSFVFPAMQNFKDQDFNTGKTHPESDSTESNSTQPNLAAPGMNWRSKDYDLGDQSCCSTQNAWGSHMSTEQGYSWARLYHAEISKLFERGYVWAVTQTMVSFNLQTLWLVFRVFPKFWGRMKLHSE